MAYHVVGAEIDTWILNVKGELPPALNEELDQLKAVAQETDMDLATPWQFAGQVLHIKPHGSGRQWRWILHCPSLHLDIGCGRLNGIIGKARLASAFLWEHGPSGALTLLYAFLVGFFGEGFAIQVGEVHLCADVAGWELFLDDAPAFLSRGHKRRMHIADDDGAGVEDTAGDGWESMSPAVNLFGRRCTGFEFSKGAPHSCTIYDKTTEITLSRKQWMQAVWEGNGWDGEARVTRVEFRYKRDALRELGVEEPYAFLDLLPGLWAYSSRCWLRHTVPNGDPNRGRWPTSPQWEAVQQADPYGDGEPAVRTRKVAGDLRLICQMLAGCSTTAAAFLSGSGELPETDDGSGFLRWFYEWMLSYLDEKGLSFELVRAGKQVRLGVVQDAPGDPAA